MTSELTIKGLLGHSSRGVTQGYVHLDVALVVAAERVSAEIANILDGKEALLAANINTRLASRNGVERCVDNQEAHSVHPVDCGR